MLLVPFFRGFARHLHTACLALIATSAAALAQTNLSTAADGYDPNVDGNVFAMVAQGDGKIIIVGQFKNVSPNGGISIARNNIARLNADGTLDLDFNPDTDGAVRAVAIQGNAVVIGGDFTKVGGEAHSGLARIDLATGKVDSAFKAGVAKSTKLPTTPQVFALAIQDSDKAILVGGSFGTAISTSGTSAERNNIARFNSAGVLDVTYDPNPDGMVLAMALHTNEKLIIGGGFTKLQENGKSSASTRLRVARLNKDGTLDSEFDPKANNGVTTIAIQRDGKILLGGYFTTLQPPGNTSPANLSHIARLNADEKGTLDSEFYPVVGGNVSKIVVAPDGGILVGGSFTQVWGRGENASAVPYIARFTADGIVDQNFFAGVNGEVDAIVFQPDGKVVLGGYFTRAQPAGLFNASIRNHVARILPNGSLDAAFQLDQGGRVLASVIQDDGKVVIGGSFTNVGGVTRNYMARLNADGTLDTSYNPNLNAPVYALAYDSSSNKVLAGGAFTTVGSDGRDHLARLNAADGSVDSQFNVKVDGNVGSILIQSDKKIVIAGTFGNVQPFGASSATARANIARLSDTGELDAGFNPTTSAGISGMALQSDGKIIIVGAFTALQPGATGNATGRNYIARLNADGTLDANYDPNANLPINAVALQDDKAIIGGRFQAFLPRGATAVVERKYLARVNADGSIDSTFNPNPNNMVLAVAVQPSDKKILVGGIFTIFEPLAPTKATNWIQARYVGRLNSDGSVDTGFNLDISELGGNRVDSFAVNKTTGDILVGGTFTSLQPTGSTSRVLRNRFARIKSNGTLDTAFDPGAGGTTTSIVRALAVQTDGKIVVGGSFTDLGGAAGKNIARFNPEGSPDFAFNTALSTEGGTGVNAIAVQASGVVRATQLGGLAWLENNGTLRTTFIPDVRTQGSITAVGVQSDGAMILAGSFSDLTNQTKGNILRISPTGKVDAAYTPSVGGAISDLIVEPDDSVVIVGSFTTVNNTTRNYIARIKKDGSLDTVFDPNPNGPVRGIVRLNDGSYIFGGSFTSLSPNGTTTAVTRNNLAKVDKNGVNDASYNPNLNGAVNSLVKEASEKVIAGGSFTTAQPNTDTSTTTRNFIARFETNGNLDKNFNPDANGIVNDLVLEPANQSVVLVGAFTTVGGATHKGLARVGSDGAVDNSFTPAVNNIIQTVARASDGSILIGGFFTTVTPNGSTAAIARNHVARLTSTGTLDSSFNPDVAGTVSLVAAGPGNSVFVGGNFNSLQPAGLLLVGGNFDTIGGVSQKNLAQINGDGSINAGFQPNPNGTVDALLALPDGRFIVAGAFTSLGGAARTGIARFTADNVLDTTFNAGLTGSASSLALQADGKILVGTAGLTGLIRLNADGTRDNSFTAAAPFVPAVAIAVQPDGKILVAGPGSGVGSRVLRLNSDGTVDASFATASAGGGDIQALELQTDGSVIVSGSFTSLGGSNVARLTRLRSNGTVDTSFNPAPNGTVSAVALQSDGRVLIGSSFTAVGGLQRVALARVSNTASATQALGVSPDGKTITWVRRGTGGELAAVTFEQSTDAQSWTVVGTGTRVGLSSDWQLTNVTTLPKTSSFFIRARGIAPSSAGKSSSVYESVRLENLASPVPSTALVVAPVSSGVLWDESHYVWTIDEAGIIRIADAFSFAVLDPNKSVLVGGGKPTTAGSAARLADISTRGGVNASSPLIAGFSITGTSARAVLVRAVGPTLASFGVTDFLKTPQVRLYNAATGALIGANNGWNNDTNLAATFTRTGAFPFLPGSADAALVTTLFPGSYTVQVIDGGTTGGNALVEIYDAGDLADSSSRLVNLSSRGTVSANTPLIGGLYVSGNAAKALLIRGAGPALAKFNVGGAIADPVIIVYDVNGREVVRNDNWQVAAQPTIPELDFGAAMSGAAASVGAFQFDNGSKDAALVVTLPSGAYTVQVVGANGSSGAALIEVYELP